MAELKGIDLGTNLKAILAEYRARKSIFGYPERKFYRGFPGIDLAVDFHDKRAATLLGPASGPHTQMVQNILLAFLGGGRIIELKTIQILDQLEIPRPCIDARNVGYNVEWSQELRLEESYAEYVKAWVLLKILEEMELLGIPKGDPFYDVVFDVSVGYGLEGISSPAVHRWLEDMRDAGPFIEQLLDDLPSEFAAYKNLRIDPHIVDSATLSTFHGCPPDEIEAIVEHLISEHNLHVIVKMNPTILGYDFVEKTLHQDLGYTDIELDRQAFDNDLQFSDGVAMMKRLEEFARKHGKRVGAKFTNTLIVKNNQQVFTDEVMYLSGPPLHVLAMNAMHRFRSEMGASFHISFSAGITKHNFVEAVRCNMRPITVCTDLLKTGGYTRLYDYLENLKKAMEEQGVATVEEFIIGSAGDPVIHELAAAGMANANAIVPTLIENPRHQQAKNLRAPPKIDSHLTLFDCLTCNKCLPVCPNAANFSIPTGTMDLPTTDYRFDGSDFIPVPGERFVLKKAQQIANLADFCNECGDCDTYCPEYGGPFVEKPRFFSQRSSYEHFKDHDGFFFPHPFAIQGRIGRSEYTLAYDRESSSYHWQSEAVSLTLDENDRLIAGRTLDGGEPPSHIDMTSFYIMKVLLRSLIDNQDSYPAVILRG